jgi:hypothetical protein
MGCGCNEEQGQVNQVLLGAIPQQLPGISGGSPFQFGFNVGYFNNELYRPEEIAGVLDDQALSYDTRSYAVSGYLNPYLTIEGNAVTSWPSASDFGQAIYAAVSSAGYPIDYSSIQFRFQPSGPAGSPQWAGSPYPNTTGIPGGNVPAPLPPGQCSYSQQSLADYLACQLGIKSAVGGVTAGATGALLIGGALVLVLLIAKR